MAPSWPLGRKKKKPPPLEGNAKFRAQHQLALQGNAQAQAWVGAQYYRGTNGVQQSYPKAVQWYQTSADQGYARGQFNLGVCYENGRGIPQSHCKAVQWYQASADQGNAAAQFNLGLCYEKGQGLQQNHPKAVLWYQTSADQGNSSAQYHLGVCYANGNGVTQDWGKAVQYYELAAQQGHAKAQSKLKTVGQEMEKERQRRQRDEKRKLEEEEQCLQQQILQMQQLQDNASSGDMDPQYQLATVYDNGDNNLGVQQDQERAFHWLEKAAEQGHVEAEVTIGKCYETGVPVKDEYLAFNWYEMAAKEGSNEAMFHCGRCFEEGIGVEAIDLEKACDWYETAIYGGYTLARSRLVKANASLRRKRSMAASSTSTSTEPKQPLPTCTTETENVFDAFLIHTREQKAGDVASLKYFLENECKYSSFLDFHMKRADPPDQTMEECLEYCRHAIAVVSKSFLTKKSPCAELKYAFDRMNHLRNTKKWQSLWVILYDLTVEDFKRAWEASDQILPPIHHHVQVFEYESGTGRYPLWTELFKELKAELMDVDRFGARHYERGAVEEWKDFLDQGGPKEVPGFPRAQNVYTVHRSETGCVEVDFWNSE